MSYSAPFGICLLIISVLQTISFTNGTDLRPVHERSDEQKADSYGNPLGGNSRVGSRQRVKIYMNDQQKRFNSEKDRMQRAQMQRFQINGGKTMDSYIKAYKDQQDTYQKEIEAKHAVDTTNATRVAFKENLNYEIKKEVDHKASANTVPYRWWKSSSRPVRNNRGVFKNVDSTAARTNLRGRQIGRPHSTRSVAYVLSPKYFTPSIPYEGNGGNRFGFTPQKTFLNPIAVSSNPGGDFAPGPFFSTEDVSALTSDALSNDDAQQFSQLSGYKSNDDVESLTALLGKEPDDQLRGLNELLKHHSNHKVIEDDLRNFKINIKASSLDPPAEAYVKKYDYISPYSTNTQRETYGYTYDDNESGSHQTKDHTPITENVQDVADTRGPVRFTAARPVYATENPLGHTRQSYSASSFGSVNDEVSIENEAASIFNNLKWELPRVRPTQWTPPVRISSTPSSVPRIFLNSTEISNNTSQNIPTVLVENDTVMSNDFVNSDSSDRSIVKRHINSNLNDKRMFSVFSLPFTTIRLKRTTLENKLNNDNIFPESIHSTSNSSNVILDSNIFLTSKDVERLNDPLKSTVNGDNEATNDNSEFYYYDDSESNGTDVDFDGDFFSSDDDSNISNSSALKYNLENLNGMNVSSDNPHFESLIRYRIRKRPNLYRVLNGVKSKIVHPNPARFKRLLIKRPPNGFMLINKENLYGTRNYGYQNERPSTDSGEYSDTYEDVEYPEESDSGNDYNDNVDYGNPLSSGKTNLNHYKQKPFANINDHRHHSQHRYAPSYITNNEDIAVDEDQNYYHNKRNKYDGLNSFHDNVRYASDYDQEDDYVDGDYEADSAPDGQTKYFNTYPASDNSDYTDSRNAYLDYFKKLTKNRDGNAAASQYYSSYSPSDNGEHFYKPNNYETENHDDKDGDAGNYYIENFNQFITTPREKKRKSPQSNFNIYRAAADLGHKLHSINPGERFPYRPKKGETIHIDAINVFHEKRQRAKPHRHHQRLHRFRKVKHSHRARRPQKWHRPKFSNRRLHDKAHHVLHVQKNINKINAKLAHARILR